MKMSNPLRLSILAAALAFSPVLANVASAEDAAPPATRPARGEGRQFNPGAGIERYEKALAELTLTDEQKPKVEAAVAKAKAEFAALQANPPTGEGRERFAPYLKVTTDMREAVGAVLTEDQKEELASKVVPPGRGGQGGPGGMQQRMIEELGLTDEQKTQVQTIMEEGQKKMKALREEGGDREAMREKGQAIRGEQQKAIEAVLTPEQNEKLAKLRESRPQRGPGGQDGERRRPKQPL